MQKAVLVEIEATSDRSSEMQLYMARLIPHKKRHKSDEFSIDSFDSPYLPEEMSMIVNMFKYIKEEDSVK